jgi:hypothetical protein
VEILTVLRLIGAGHSKSIVASTTGHSRTTVRRYVALAVELGWKLGHEEPTEQLAAEISRRLNPAADRDAGDTEQLLLPLRASRSASG